MHNDAARFESFEHYCALLDQAMNAFDAPVMNGLPLLDEVKQRIAENRISYWMNGDCFLLLCPHGGFEKLYYIVRRGAALSLPQTDKPVIAEEIRIDSKAYPDNDALMEQSGFALRRVNASIEVDLRSTTVPDTFFGFSEIEPARHEDLPAIDALMRSSFDEILDDIPTREELEDYFEKGAVYVLRLHGGIIAVTIYATKGKMIMVRWTAINERYRNLGLGYSMSLFAEEKAKKQGLTHSLSWINVELDAWIKGFEHYGHKRGRRLLYLFEKKA